MDYQKLDREVANILEEDFHNKSYSDIRKQLVEQGYNNDEIKYIMGIVDEKGVAQLMSGGTNRVAKRNMILGGILSFIALLVIATSYFGQPPAKEVYYVSLAIFVVGYLIFRNGYRRYRQQSD